MVLETSLNVEAPNFLDDLLGLTGGIVNYLACEQFSSERPEPDLSC